MVDQAGEPMPGVNVIEKGTTHGNSTDIDGKYKITVSGAGAILVFSFIGYRPQEIALGAKRTIDVTMDEAKEELDQVVVIGYGTVKKSDLTGSVTSVSSVQFRDQPVKRIEDILQGRTAGTEVTTLSGMPGAGSKVRVRGTTSINKDSSPLFVVDGVVSTTGLEGISPSDIQSIEVLKDASSTAIYGSRGANGVMLVTTRRGEEGRTQITLNAELGISRLMKRYDLLNPYEYSLALNDIWGANTISPADMEAYQNGTKGIDWQDLMTQTGISQDYKLSISGGNPKTQYLISGNVLDQTAITITSRFQRYQFRANLNTEVKPWFSIETNLNGGMTKMHNNSVDLMNAINYSPTMEMTDANGVYNKDPYNSLSNNPYGGLVVNYNDQHRYFLNGTVDLRFKLLEGLTLSILGGANYYQYPTYSFTSKLSAPGQINSMANASTTSLYWQSTNNLTYQKNFGDHELTATAVWEISKSEAKSLNISGSNLSNELVGYYNVRNALTPGLSNNGYSSESIASGIFRVMYNYKSRYLVTGTFRADASSKFQKTNKWGYFPSGAIAWNIANESFMAHQKIFQQLKLRASFGVTGNQGIGSYNTLGLYTNTVYGWGTSTPYTGYWDNSWETPGLRWESTYQYNAGADFGVWQERLNVSFDWFRKESKDLLFLKSIPAYNGGGSYWVNQGELRNTGVEISIDAFPVKRSGLLWESTLNAAYLKNTIIDLAGEDFILMANHSDLGGNMEIMKPGHPLGTFYLFKWAGFDDQGANLFQKADGSLTRDPAPEDQRLMGQANPEWTFGWNNMLTWKNWTASVFINAATGFDRLNLTRFASASMVGAYRFISLRDSYFNGWDQVANKADAQFPSHVNTNNKEYGNSDFWLEDASFIKLKNISIAYTFPKDMLKFFGAQASFSVQNVFTLTKYKGMDPEVYSTGSGIDFGAYPIPRTFTFGLKLIF